MTFTTKQKLEAVRREIRQRVRVYPRLEAEHRMSPDKAAHELGVMRAIEADYAAQLRREEPGLFDDSAGVSR